MADKMDAETRDSSVRRRLAPVLFGVVFGFLLQKGGVAKYGVLVGQLLLEDFTVMRVMASAIVVGMIGVAVMHRMGMVRLHVKKTRYAANIVGGLVFGVGFALAGYCPGTGAAALGQGNYDAVSVIVGMMAGSYLFALLSDVLGRTLQQWGDRGEQTLPRILGASQLSVAAGLAVVLILGLAALSRVQPQ